MIRWNGKNYSPKRPSAPINQSIEELMKPLSEKTFKGNIWRAQIIMNVPQETSGVVVTPTPTSTVPVTPSPTPTGTPASTTTPTPTRTASVTPTPTNTPSNTPTGTPNPTTTPTPTRTASVTSTPTNTGTPTRTPNPTPTPTNTPTNTGTPNPTPTNTGTPNPTPTPTPTQVPFLLNSYTGATSGYSLRKLSSTYAGNAIRVRRSSDNTEQNIGFNGNVIDVSALTTFVGANNGFIVTWYDQTENAYNMSNSTATQQPMIVSGGTVLSDSKGYYALFDGSNDNLSAGVNAVDGLFTQGNVSYSTYFVGLTTGTEQTFISQGNAGSNNTLGFSTQATNGYGLHYWYANDMSTNVDFRNTNIIAGLTYVVGGTRTTSINAVANTTDTPGAHSQGQSGQLTYIGRAGFAESFYLNGRFRELVVYNINKSADTSNIKSNMNSYYGIY